MLRLLKIEYLKLKSANYFKVLSLFWLLAFVGIPIGFKSILSSMDGGIGPAQNALLNPANWPIFDFKDLWQNLAYAYKYVTIFLSLTLVISTANEFRNKTIRQNVIDGLSRKEFFLSKINYIFIASTIAVGLMVFFGLLIGLIYSPVTDIASIFSGFEFVLAYYIHLIHFLMLSFFLTVLIRRSGLSIAAILFYVYIIEPILCAVLSAYDYNYLTNFLPSESGWSLIRFPYFRYIFDVTPFETQDYLSLMDISTGIIWIFIFTWGSYRLLSKRDL